MPYKKYDIIRNVYGGTQSSHTPTLPALIKKSYYRYANFKTTSLDFIKSHTINTCWYGKIAIQENGNVIPCVFERNISYGNCKKTSIENILHNANTQKHWFWNYNNVNICKDCEYKYCCKDCRVLAKAVNGRLEDKTPRCKYDPYTGTWNN